MQIQRGHDRHLRPDDLAHCSKYLAIGVTVRVVIIAPWLEI